VFLCNNNQWAISLPVARQTASATLAEKAAAYGLEGVRVDGMDALAVYRATREALDKARSGGGPTLVEAITYRFGPHSSSDDPSRYRDESEAARWRERDPIVVFRRYLERTFGWSDARDAALEAEIGGDITRALAEAERAPAIDAGTFVTDVYADVPWHLREQLASLSSTTRR
jgi:pyruvate dehydrogenase E1 component alpha subunit/2-oxoisovalerate dehydrogenase E1 component alpha subunit